MDEQMKAGRNLDVLIATRVLGWRHTAVQSVECLADEAQQSIDDQQKCVYRIHPNSDLWDLPAFSTDIAAAWQVVERLRAKGLLCVISSPSPGYTNWDVRGWNPETNASRYIAHADTAPLAICLAALKAVEAVNAR